MLTQEQIEDTGFKYWRTSFESPSNKSDRDDYLALGTKFEGQNREFTIVLLLSYTIDGFLTITDYFNDPLPYREYYVGYTQVINEQQLTDAIEGSGYIISEIDISRLQADYK